MYTYINSYTPLIHIHTLYIIHWSDLMCSGMCNSSGGALITVMGMWGVGGGHGAGLGRVLTEVFDELCTCNLHVHM